MREAARWSPRRGREGCRPPLNFPGTSRAAFACRPGMVAVGTWLEENEHGGADASLKRIGSARPWRALGCDGGCTFAGEELIAAGGAKAEPLRGHVTQILFLLATPPGHWGRWARAAQRALDCVLCQRGAVARIGHGEQCPFGGGGLTEARARCMQCCC